MGCGDPTMGAWPAPGSARLLLRALWALRAAESFAPCSAVCSCVNASLASGLELSKPGCVCVQSLPEEEQQRVLGEEKMLGSNRKGATSPASKKSSPETGKVRGGQGEGGHTPGTWGGWAAGAPRGLTHPHLPVPPGQLREA